MERTHTYIPALGRTGLTPLYDPLMAWVLQERCFKLPLIAAARIQPEQRVLDLGCGTATLTLLIKQRHVTAEVVGIDIDADVLTIARDKVRHTGRDIVLQQGSADQLPYAAQSFDCVVSSMMLHHLTSAQKQQTLREVLRVLRPTGRLLLLDFGLPKSRLAALLARRFRGFEQLADNLDGKLAGYFMQAGFTDVQTRPHAYNGLLTLYQGQRPAV